VHHIAPVDTGECSKHFGGADGPGQEPLEHDAGRTESID